MDAYDLYVSMFIFIYVTFLLITLSKYVHEASHYIMVNGIV